MGALESPFNSIQESIAELMDSLDLLVYPNPFNKATSPLNSAYDVPADKQEQVKAINKIILDEIKNKETIFVIGQFIPLLSCFSQIRQTQSC